MIKCTRDYDGEYGKFSAGQYYLSSTDIEKDLVDGGYALFTGEAVETASVTRGRKRMIEKADYT